MRALVRLQDALKAEALAALRAHEGPLPTVQAQVLTELAVVCEAAATLAAGKGPLPAVSPRVGAQRSPPGKAQRTLWALEGLLIRVQPLMAPQLSPLVEAPAALGTLERPLPGGVEPAMGGLLLQVTKAVAEFALGALEWALPPVGGQMPL